MDSPRPRPPIHNLPPSLLLLPPLILLLSTLTLHLLPTSSIQIPFLWSQCHARSRLPSLSHIPLLGAPVCFIISFFLESLSSLRSVTLLASALTFLAGLLTISAVESARICNAPVRLIRYPTWVWMLFNLFGGAVVWEVVIIPTFLMRGRQVVKARREEGGMVEARHPERGEEMRFLASAAEGWAIPLAVALGCVLPGILMLVIPSPVTVMVWLFFPLWTSLIRQIIRAAATRLRKERFGQTLHLETSWGYAMGMYALPILASILAHGFLVYNLLSTTDDRKEMTRATIKFIEIDALFISLSVVYWLFVEAGWRTAGVMVLASVLAGPGAGVCVAWVYRERWVDLDRGVRVVAVGARREEAGEDTPLLR